MLRIGVSGALGRMGREIEAALGERDDMHLAARIARPGAVEAPIHPLPLDDPEAALGRCEVVIDVSTASAAARLARLAARRGGPALVIGATGFTADEEDEIAQAARAVAILKSGNFSLGAALLARLVETAAASLGPKDWDIEIVEAHHRRKRDAPSGTALQLGAAAGRGRGEDQPTLARRHGVTGVRPVGGIGYAVVRGGGLIGEHSVVFAAEDEILTLSHSARDRRVFARGALAAAAFLVGAEPGLYAMSDVVAALAH